jgi:hypothetical protein
MNDAFFVQTVAFLLNDASQKTLVRLVEYNVKFLVMWSPGSLILQYAEEGVLQIKIF